MGSVRLILISYRPPGASSCHRIGRLKPTKPKPTMIQQTLFAVAVSGGQALQIERSLTEAGFSNDNISALIPDFDPADSFAEVPMPSRHGTDHTRGSTGGVLGGAIDLLASIGELVIPGVGRLIAAGPLVVALNGIAAGAAFIGIAGALVGIGVPEITAKRYESRISRGDILMSVHAESATQMEKAREIFKSADAEDIASAAVPSARTVRLS